MSALPSWIEDRLARGPPIHPSHRVLIEALLESDRPMLSVEQFRNRLDEGTTDPTVRERLEELEEIGIFCAESYPDSVTLYYLDEPESTPAGPSIGSSQLAAPNPLDALSANDFVAFREPDAIRTLVLAGYQLSLVLFITGIVLSVVGIDGVVDAGNDPGTAATYLFTLCLVVHGVERIVRRNRSDR